MGMKKGRLGQRKLIGAAFSVTRVTTIQCAVPGGMVVKIRWRNAREKLHKGLERNWIAKAA
jgi:hypothetical protein